MDCFVPPGSSTRGSPARPADPRIPLPLTFASLFRRLLLQPTQAALQNWKTKQDRGIPNALDPPQATAAAAKAE